MRTTVINNNIDEEGARAPSIQFCEPNKRIVRVKLIVFVLTVATSGPHLTFE